LQQHPSLIDFKYHCAPASPPTVTLSWGEKTEHAQKVHGEQVKRWLYVLP